MKRFLCLLFGIGYAASSSLSIGSALSKRNLDNLICPGETVYAAGSNNFVKSLALSVQNDSYLQSFVAPLDSTLCSLSFAINVPSSEVSARLDFYDNTTPQINVVKGIAKPIISVSVFSVTDLLAFPFCSAQQSLTAGSVYTLAIALKSNSASLSLNFGDSGAQGIFFGPSFGSQGQVQNVGLTFNLTAGTSKPSCSKTTTISSTTASSTTISVPTTSKTTKTTTTPTKTTNTPSSTASSSPVVYCKCRGVVKFDGHLQKRDGGDELDDEDDFDDEEFDEANDDFGLKRRGISDRRINNNKRHTSHLFKRALSKYTIRFKTKCGSFTCKCMKKKLSVNYISSDDLNFDSFGTC